MKHMVKGLALSAMAIVGFAFAAQAATTIYVDGKSTAEPAEPYGKDTPFKLLGDAVAYAKSNKDSVVYEIRVATGTYTQSFALDFPVTVTSDSGNRGDVIISHGGYPIVTVSHADAVLSSVTIHNTTTSAQRNWAKTGGCLNLTKGLVEDCVIENGYLGYMGNGGGNITISDGRLVRCLVQKGTCSGSSSYPSLGGGIYATGGSIESCLVRENSANGGSGIYIASGAVKVINCTVVDNKAGLANYGSGIHVASGTAKVINTIVFNNGGTSAATEFGSANLAAYTNCASAFASANWRLIDANDFINAAQGDHHLSGASLLVDAGIESEFLLSDLDVEGLARKSGSSVDLGCYELDQSKLSVGGALSTYGATHGEEMRFTAKARGVAEGETVTYRWELGNGETVVTNEEVFSYAYPTCGLYTVRVSASVNAGADWCDWTTLAVKLRVAPSETFVDERSANPLFPYDTPEHAATNLRMAFDSLTNSISGDLPYMGTVVIVKGAKLPAGADNTGFTLKYPVTVRGETGDPADAEIVDQVTGKRVFTLSHDDAVVRDLTISGTGLGTSTAQNGGHVNMSKGLVENCVIRQGGMKSGDTGGGGNVWMSGGRLSRCQILNGTASNTGAGTNNSGYGGNVRADGGVIESCLVKGGSATYSGGIYVKGAAKVVNCTVIGNSGGAGFGRGIHLADAGALVANTVMYGNGGSAENEFGNKNLGCYRYCASSVTNASCATWTVIGESAFVSYNAENYELPPDSPLVDAGTLDVPAGVQVLADGALDILGSVRKSGASLDIGAYELDQSLTAKLVGTYGVEDQATGFEASAEHEPGETPRFKWNFGDGTGDHETPDGAFAHVFETSGLFDVSVSVSLDGGTTWSKAKHLSNLVLVIPEVVYVDPASENPTAPYGTKATAARTLKDAFGMLTNTWSANLPCAGTVVIVKGAKLPAGADNTGFTLQYPVTVKGETGDPADAEIVDQVAGKRVFTLSHDDAVVRDLTISGTGINMSGNVSPRTGGHVEMSKGLVENCVIKDGYFNVWSGRGGNVNMSGGRLSRCQILNGTTSGAQAGNNNASVGGGVFASGGVIESCLVKGNKAAGNGVGGGIFAIGGAKVVNCTVVNNTAPGTSYNFKIGDMTVVNAGYGITLGSTTALAANCAIYGNGTTALTEYGDANRGNYGYCASAFTNGLDEATCKLIDETAFKDYAKWQERGELRYLAPAAGKPLNNGGTGAKDYPATGATSDKDLLGRSRISGRRVDIGALETPNACSYILLR